MMLISLHCHLLRDQVELHSFLQKPFAICAVRVLCDYLLDDIIELNFLEDFSNGYVTAVLMALCNLAYERCETGQPSARVLPLIVSHEFDKALLVGLSANPSVLIVIFETLFDQFD